MSRRTFTTWGHVIFTKMLIPRFCSVFLPLHNEQDNKIKTKEALTQQYHHIKILQKLGKSKMKIYSSCRKLIHTLRYLSTRILKISKMNWSSLLNLYYMSFASSYLITWTKSSIFSSFFLEITSPNMITKTAGYVFYCYKFNLRINNHVSLTALKLQLTYVMWVSTSAWFKV